MAWRKRGRPRLATARRRATTCAGRRSPEDLGSPELIKRKARVANGSAVPVELVDTAGILLAHHLIEPEELLILRLVASWWHQVRVAFGLPAGSPGGLWAAITTGQRGGGWAATLSATSKGGGDRALFRLAELYAHFAGLAQLDRLALVMRIAAGETAPANRRTLAELRTGCRLSPICSATAAPGIARESDRAISGRSAEEPQRGAAWPPARDRRCNRAYNNRVIFAKPCHSLR